MAFYNIIVVVDQSTYDGRLADKTNVPYLLDKVLDNVVTFNGSAIVPYSIVNPGAAGNGTSIVLANSNDNWGPDLPAFYQLGQEIPNLMIFKWTSGGARLCVDGANDVNGCWSVNFDGMTAKNPAMVQLNVGLQNKWNAWKAFAAANGHSYRVICIYGKQGEADNAAPKNYPAEFSAWMTWLRNLFSVPALPILWATVPFLSNAFNKAIRTAQMNYRRTDPNFYLKDISLGTLSDLTHVSEATAFDLAEWLVDTTRKILNPPAKPVPAAQRSNRAIFDQTVAIIKAPNLQTEFLNKTGIIDADAIEAIEFVLDAFKSPRDIGGGVIVPPLGNKIKFFWPMLGDTLAAQRVNLLNSRIFELGAAGAGHVHTLTGWQLPGLAGRYIDTGLKISDVKGLGAMRFGVSLYSRTNQVNANVVDITIPVAATKINLRVFPSYSASAARMRMDIEDTDVNDGSFALLGNIMVDTLGLLTCQMNPILQRAEIAHKGVFQNSKAFVTQNEINVSLRFGYDATSGNRESGKEYAGGAVHDYLITNELIALNSIVHEMNTRANRQV